MGPHGNERVQAWAASQDGRRLCLGILTLGGYEKGLHNLPTDSPARPRIVAALGALEGRFAERLLPASNAVVRRCGAVSETVKRTTGHAPPVIDTLLAATALEHDLYLATRNVRDVQHSGAAVFNECSRTSPFLDTDDIA